jgi:peptide-methionine (R)-S-oxide reductase
MTEQDWRAIPDAEWRKRLDAEAYRVLRQAGTERPFSGALNKEKRTGTFHCAACDAALFKSDAKFESGCGWPSFFEPLEAAAMEEVQDTAHGMVRTEIRCKRCGSHLGHVFPDGPPPTGLRYCINSVCLKFDEQG